MKKIDIQINQAKIVSYTVELEDEMPHITAKIGLFVGNKKISEFGLSTRTYYDMKFDIPNEVIAPIKDIAEQLETILIRQCSSAMGQLPAPKKAKK